jgi:hypothetical protein
VVFCTRSFLIWCRVSMFLHEANTGPLQECTPCQTSATLSNPSRIPTSRGFVTIFKTSGLSFDLCGR